jgi:hypothetical protein
MSVAKQLYQLQECDLEIESNEQALRQIASQLGESQAVTGIQQKLEQEKQRQEELARQQHAAEWEIDDLNTKLTTAEEELYSGRIRNPKELANLQHEIDLLKDKRGQLEDKVLGIMEQVELTTKGVATLDSQLKTLETEWQGQQLEFSAQLEKLKATVSDLKRKRQLLANEIDPQAIEVYQGLRKQKGAAVARVEQGICRGCRISLPVSELQQVRSGNPVRCSSCGRILFLA